MPIRVSGIRAGFAAALLIASAVSSRAQVYVESFDGPLPSAMLNGGIILGSSGPWSTRIANGALELENQTADHVLRYLRIERVIYPGSAGPVATEDATVEATIRAVGEERSGAGVVVRFDSRSKDYLLFAIGPRGNFNLVLRKNGKARYTAAGANDAIRVGAANRVLAKSFGAMLVFEVNGREVLRMPGDELKGRFVGIGAFGRGTFSFDEVRIAAAGVEFPPPR